jgi:hypothetical protein
MKAALYHPKFVEAMEKLDAMTNEEQTGSDEAQLLMAQAIKFAPKELKPILEQGMRKRELAPEPVLYTEDGEPAFSLKKVADILGVTEEEALSHVRKLEESAGETLLIDVKDLERKH